MTLKSGVRILGIRPETLFAWTVAQALFVEHNVPAIMTSCVEGKHSPGSKHYVGCAFDMRANHIAADKAAWLKDELAARLGADFDVILEKTADGKVSHIHVELDPKTPLSA